MKNKYRGGILLTALLFLFLFSFIFTLVLEDFQMTQRFSQKTTTYYIAKTMVSMFLSDVKQGHQLLEEAGQQHFSTGTFRYEYDQRTVKFTVQINQITYKFQEEYQQRKKSDT